jgi:hypothetical protein
MSCACIRMCAYSLYYQDALRNIKSQGSLPYLIIFIDGLFTSTGGYPKSQKNALPNTINGPLTPFVRQNCRKKFAIDSA